MGKHSKEKEKSIKKIIISLIFIILIICAIFILINNNHIKYKYDFYDKKSTTELKTIKNEQLIIKSTTDYNKVIQFSFNNDILNNVKIYEEFLNLEELKKTEESYKSMSNIKIVNTDEQKFSIEIEKLDFVTDTDLTYDEIYDKYLVQIVGAYEIVE